MGSPFQLSAVVDSYEDWFHTPYGKAVEGIQIELIFEQLAPLAMGSTVLDIGCGTGWLGMRMVERGYAVVGVDPSGPMLSRARSRLPVARATRCRSRFATRVSKPHT